MILLVLLFFSASSDWNTIKLEFQSVPSASNLSCFFLFGHDFESIKDRFKPTARFEVIKN